MFQKVCAFYIFSPGNVILSYLWEMRCIKAAFPTIPLEYSREIRNPFLGTIFFRKDFESVMKIDKSFQGIAVEGKEANLIKVTNRWLAMLLT